MTGTGTPFAYAAVGGVPCFWADAAGPCTAGLLFRVGRADELLSNGGVTELAARLAVDDRPGGRVDHSAHVTSTTTAFYATGQPGDVFAFLERLCRTLHDLPGDRIDGERRVLAIEEEREQKDVGRRLLMMRFGATGHGLPFYDRLGLRWLRAEHVASWARQWFTLGNAALWMTCPPPDGIALPLPDGPRMPPPEPRPLPGVDLPAYAASGSGAVASTVLARRSAAIGLAARAVADRAHAELCGERGLAADVTGWQFPLTGELTHRQLSVDCDDDAAADALGILVAIYDDVASGGPTAGELAAARDAAVGALRDDEAVAGGLDAMAVDELMGAPRRWKEDIARDLDAVTPAAAAGALREALATQLLVAPAAVSKPSERLHDYPWFSRDRVQGRELRPARRGGDVRLVVGAEGVSHLSEDSGRGSTVRHADVAAALQEPDGSLTLIGRDGAIVSLDPQAFRGAREAIADLERTLPAEVLIPPRDATAGGGGVDAVAGRKLEHRFLVEAELKLLGERLDPDEEVANLAHATIGFKPGLLALTDRRVMWLHQGDREALQRELPYGEVVDVRMSRYPRDVVTLRSGAGETAFSRIRPRERGPELVDEVRRRVAAARAAEPHAAPGPPPQ